MRERIVSFLRIIAPQSFFWAGENKQGAITGRPNLYAASETPPVPALFRLRPHSRLTLLVDLDVNDVRPTADGTVFDILLCRARRCIDWYHNFFAAAVAHIARIAAHGNDSIRTMADT